MMTRLHRFQHERDSLHIPSLAKHLCKKNSLGQAQFAKKLRKVSWSGEIVLR